MPKPITTSKSTARIWWAAERSLPMLDSKAGDLLINTEKLSNAEGTFNFYMTRLTAELEEEFSAEEIALQEGALVYINYAEWNDANPGRRLLWR